MQLRQLSRSIVLIVFLWVLTMIALPIVRWTLGDAALHDGILLGVFVQVTAVLVILWRAWGARRTLLTIGTVLVLAWLAEVWGSSTGFPFGAYYYTRQLQPQLAGVPLLVPLAWLMMFPPAWAVAAVIHSRYHLPDQGWRGALAFAALSGLAFTAWDLFLDPQMAAWDFWVWSQPGSYFGIPWMNYIGWFFVSTLITWLLRPKDLPVTPLLLIYAITWVLETIGQLFFWDLPGPAAFGFLGMGGMLFWAFYPWRSS